MSLNKKILNPDFILSLKKNFEISQFESIGYIESSVSKRNTQFTFSGELQFFQNNAFQDKTTDTAYNVKIKNSFISKNKFLIL